MTRILGVSYSERAKARRVGRKVRRQTKYYQTQNWKKRLESEYDNNFRKTTSKNANNFYGYTAGRDIKKSYKFENAYQLRDISGHIYFHKGTLSLRSTDETFIIEMPMYKYNRNQKVWIKDVYYLSDEKWKYYHRIIERMEGKKRKK